MPYDNVTQRLLDNNNRNIESLTDRIISLDDSIKNLEKELYKKNQARDALILEREDLKTQGERVAAGDPNA